MQRWASQEPAPHRDLCTDCGVSRTSDPKRCGTACQFIAPDYPKMEAQVHGRVRASPTSGENQPSVGIDAGAGRGNTQPVALAFDTSAVQANSDELFFGPYQRLYRAALQSPSLGAQWTGITTRIAERLLEEGRVDAVLTMAPDEQDQWRPVPVLVTRKEDLASCRGMRMGYAPLLAMLEPAKAQGIKRLAVIGIPCQVYALRSLEKELGFEKLYVIGTPCSDNTTTERFHEFLNLISDQPETITYLEFCADYHVEIRFNDGRTKRIPFLMLPLSKLPPDFFPLTCRTCVDYTNVLSDITVGYMGGEGQQWLIVRNDRGAELLDLLGDEVSLAAPGSAGKRQGPVKGFMQNTERAAGGLPLRSMPNWLRPLVGRLMPKVGPRGLEFARARVEMKAVETVIHLRRQEPKRMKSMVPDHVWQLVTPYGLTPSSAEQPESSSRRPAD